MPSKNYSVIVTPSDGSKSYHLQVSVRALMILAGILLMLGIGVVFLGVTYGELMYKVRNWSALNGRVAEMEEKQIRLAGLEQEIEELREMDRQVRQLVGLPERPLSERMGNGGMAALPESVRPPGVPDVVLADALIPDEEIAATIERKIAPLKGKLPWPVAGFVSSIFLEERGHGGLHTGIDIAAPRNTLVEAPRKGTVIGAGWHDEFGYVAIIDHGDGLETVYCHNEKLVVGVGDRVRLGDTISFLGTTGRSSAPHLHFEVRQDGYAVDPAILLEPQTVN